MIITDLSQTTPINKTINLQTIALQNAPTTCLTILTTGTFTGTPKLTISQDGTNFYPLYDNQEEEITLSSNKIIFLDIADLFIKVDLTGVVSNNLKVEIQ